MEAPQDPQQPPPASQQAGEALTTPSPSRKLTSASVRADLVAHIRGLAEACGAVPDICKRRAPGEPDLAVGAQVADWEQLRRRKEFDLLQAYPAAGLHPSTFVPTSQAVPALPDSAAAAVTAAAAAAAALPVPVPAMVPASGSVPLVPAMPAPAAMPAERQAGGGVRQVGKITKANKQKSGGRTFTSKYRGVHQTFPTRRWEAQFRCGRGQRAWVREEQAARAYDKMMLWCELHNATGVKGGITNFDASSYEASVFAEVAFLQQCTQASGAGALADDDLVQMLRSEGRRQAAQRMLKQKRDGAAAYARDNASDSENE
ncbi:hypothetical protein CHLNCDRAFT_142099 [Chlorella variabilis]|uniref:AP2/ERF domain-containing protein n=1 Tax=Chlorella variabilis TaxID=554065 RepID=E1Z7S1_CHLVA|nr:hypothetical protein CHLNCDRAFT_142099 [Chlorella variabilis]EFN58221.1 hypothetical protein CHLNCDRAFT_142099 [Chlorella variabilis]|eukprot:XP_005850323.1 hypothetical protein CHLNCDRAFT_142099 [Chlorella variabilis]